MKKQFMAYFPMAGKSTIYNLLTGLIQPEKGKIIIDGEDVTAPVYLRVDNMH